MQPHAFDRLSPTAVMVAYARQFTDIPYAQALSHMVEAQALIEQVLSQPADRPLAIAALLEGRYKAIDQSMAQVGATQVLELASGLLPRGIILSQDPDMTFVETDLPTMMSAKQKLVKQLIGARPNLHFAAIDATHRPNPFLLNLDYFDLHQPLTILCEGLLMYLTFAQKQQVFANVRELLQRYGGVWLTPDLTTKADWSLRWRIDPALQRFTQIISRLTQTSTSHTTFEHFEQVEDFAAQQGFQVEKCSADEVLEQLSCLEPLGIACSTAISLLEGLSVCTLTLKNR